MSVALKKLDGVRTVDVHLDDGTATIALAPGNHVRIAQVREVIRKNGFTPKAAHVRVSGSVVAHGGRPALEVTGTDEVLLLEGRNADAAPNRPVVLDGTLREGTTGSLTIDVERVEPEQRDRTQKAQR